MSDIFWTVGMWGAASFCGLMAMACWAVASQDDFRGGYGEARPVFHWRGRETAVGLVLMIASLILAHCA